MYYEINVAHKGRHFFATAPRSITTEAHMLYMLKVFQKMFPEEEGYTLDAMYCPEVSYHFEPCIGAECNHYHPVPEEEWVQCRKMGCAINSKTICIHAERKVRK